MTHAELIEIAARWLRARCRVVITEMAGIGEEADAIGWKTCESILIECKASCEDFKKDGRKYFRRYPEMGIGRYRYFMAPKGLIQLKELPAGFGLITVSEKRKCRKAVESFRFKEINHHRETGLLLSALQRIGQTCPPGVSVKCYTYETKRKATLGIER